MRESGEYVAILKALHFASIKHKDQRRLDEEASPYINHPIEVAELLANVGQVTDLVVLQSAILHDTIEDTQTTAAEIEELFGAEVCSIVQEVTDDKSLPKQERKRLQIEHAPHISTRAKMVKLADKISNVRAIEETPPRDWSLERRRAYLDWTEQVVAGLRGCNTYLEELYDQYLLSGRAKLDCESPVLLTRKTQMDNKKHTLNPFLAVPPGQLRPLVQSYIEVLGATLTAPLPDPATGPVKHAEVVIGDATIGLNELFQPSSVSYIWMVTANIEWIKNKIQASGGAWKLEDNAGSPIVHATDPAGVHWIFQPA